jgi:hypothetical protein
MRRRVFARVLLALAGCGFGTAISRAQDLPHPESLTHYRIVPRLSVLRQTGGFGGFDLRYRVKGHYDLHQGVGSLTGAKFENAEVWASPLSHDPTVAMVLDVDQIFNLEGLRGQLLPTAGLFRVYEFKGMTQHDEKVHLFGAVIGPWMYLRGGTMPPDGGADYFTYHLRAAARSRPFADLNDDGIVDAADYVLLRKLGGTAGVDGVTVADWTQQFGETAPDLNAFDLMLSSAIGSLGPSTAVPEPTAIGLILVGGVLLVGRRQR